MSVPSTRITVEEATRLHPGEWLIFSDPSLDGERVIDGVLFFHSKDQDLAFEKAEEIAGRIAIRYAGEPRHRNVTFESLDAVHNPAA